MWSDELDSPAVRACVRASHTSWVIYDLSFKQKEEEELEYVFARTSYIAYYGKQGRQLADTMACTTAMCERGQMQAS